MYLYLLVYNIFWVLPVQHKRMASAHPFHSLIKLYSVLSVASQVALVVKSLPANAGDVRDVGLIGKVPWRRKWQLTPVFLLGKSHGQGSLVGHSLRDHKEVDRLSGWLYVCFTESGAKPSLYFCLQGFCSFCSVFFHWSIVDLQCCEEFCFLM